MTANEFWEDFGFWRSRLSDIHAHIKSGMAEEEKPFCRKGIIVEKGDDTESRLDFVKDYLNVAELMKSGKVSELTIDDSWTASIIPSEKNDNSADFWNRIVAAAFKAKEGLLILNVSNMKLFEHCWWHIKQLAKQESELVAWEPAETSGLIPSRFEFKGYVLLVLDGLEWENVLKNSKLHQQGEFDAAMQFYSRIDF